MSGLLPRVLRPKPRQRLVRRALSTPSTSFPPGARNTLPDNTTATPDAMIASVASPQDEPLPQYAIPREKMRVLVQLYHESSDFITHENLDDRIDDAFTGAGSHVIVHETGFRQLEKKLQDMRQAPEFVRMHGIDRFSALTSSTWSGGGSALVDDRLQRVRAALWGTMPGGGPDLDIVEEEKDEIESLRALEEAMYGARKSKNRT